MLLKVKKIFWIIFLLVDLCLLGVVMGAVYYAESDAPRHELEVSLSEYSGRKVRFAENLDFVFYPWLGVSTGPFTVAALPSQDYPYQVAVKNADFRVKLLPLFRGEFEIDTIILDSPVIHVDRDVDGHLSTPSIDSEEDGSLGGFFEFFSSRVSIRGVKVENATYVYRDVASRNEYKFSGIDIRTGPLRPKQPTAFDISADLNTDFIEGMATSHIKGLLHLALEEKTMSLSDTSCSLRVESDALFGRNGTFEAIAGLNFDFNKGSIDLTGIEMRGVGVRLSGSASCQNIYDSPELTGTLSSIKFDPKALFSRLFSKEIPADIDDVLNAASLSLLFNSTLDKTEVNNLCLVVDNTEVRGKFSLQDYKNPWVEFNLQANSIVLDSYSKLFALRKTNSDVNRSEQNVSGKIKFKDLIIADLVRRIPCNGKVEIGRVVYDGLKMEDCRLFLSPGPKVATVSVEKGEYLDGKFTVKADLAFDDAKEKDTLYMMGAGSLSPISVSRLPLKIKGLKLRSGKAEFMLGSLNSSGKTLGELARNLRTDVSMEGQSVIASIEGKDVPAKFKQMQAQKVHLSVRGAPLTTAPIEGMVGRNLKLELSSILLNPSVSIGGKFSGNVFASRNSTHDLMLKDSSLELSVEGKDIPAVKQKVVFSCSGGAKLKEKSFKFDRFDLSSGRVKIAGNIYAKRIGLDTAEFQGDLRLEKTNLTDILKIFGVKKPAMQDPKGLSLLALDSSFQINGDNLNLHINKCKVDNATATGTIEIADFKKPVLSFDLQADNVDVDRFLPPNEEESDVKDTARNKSKPLVPEWEFAEGLLNSINASGRVKCDDFRIYDFAGSKISANINMEKSIIDISDIKGDFHDGNVAGKLSLGLQNSTVSLDTDIEARGFQAGLFFADYVGRDVIKGTSDASVKISGYSTANIDFIDTLSGSFAYKIVDGSYLFSTVTDEKSKVSVKGKATNFSLMQGAIKGVDGKFDVKKYLLKTAYMTAKGHGDFSIPDDSINMRIDADIIQVPNLYLKLVNSVFDALSGVNVTITGKLTDPDVSVKGLERWNDVLVDVLGVPEQSFKFLKNFIF